MPDDDVGMTRAEREKTDAAVFISEVRKIEAGSVGAVRDAADRNWKICATVAAVVFASGFIESIQDSERWVLVVGGMAIAMWLAAMVAYMSVGLRYFLRRPEVPASTGSAIRDREEALAVSLDVALDAVKFRSSIAMAISILALLATTLTLIGVAAIDGSGKAVETGYLGLTDTGVAALIGTCDLLEVDTASSGSATLDVNELGGEAPVKISFQAGVCSRDAMTVWLDSSEIVTFTKLLR